MSAACRGTFRAILHRDWARPRELPGSWQRSPLTLLAVDVMDNLRAAVRDVLDEVEDASPVQAVEAVSRQVGSALGATEVSFLVADLSGRALVRLTHSPTAEGQSDGVPSSDARGGRRDADELATSVPFNGGPAEQALRTQAVQVLPPGDTYAGNGRGTAGWTVLAPVTERGEPLGLLELSLPTEPDQDVVVEIARTAHLFGFVVMASRRHTDLYGWGQRSIPFSLSAEIQRRLLPAAYTCEAGSFTLSAWLEPADDWAATPSITAWTAACCTCR